MGLFDIFKKDRGYEIHALKFCEVGKDGKRDSRPENRLYNNARYVMPVARITSRIDRTVTMMVRMTAPDGNVQTYDFEAPLRICENQLVTLPAWGSEEGTAFKTAGWWEYELLDKKGELIISSRLHIVPVEELWDEQGWIRIESDFQFRNNDSAIPMLFLFYGKSYEDWGEKNFVNVRISAGTDWIAVLRELQRTMEKFTPGHDFNFRFIDQIIETNYRNEMRQGSCRDSVRIVKTFRIRIAELAARNKRPPVAYERILKEARERSSVELAVALDSTPEDVALLLQSRLDEVAEQN